MNDIYTPRPSNTKTDKISSLHISELYVPIHEHHS
jgi:hypothetical protein